MFLRLIRPVSLSIFSFICITLNATQWIIENNGEAEISCSYQVNRTLFDKTALTKIISIPGGSHCEVIDTIADVKFLEKLLFFDSKNNRVELSTDFLKRVKSAVTVYEPNQIKLSVAPIERGIGGINWNFECELAGSTNNFEQNKPLTVASVDYPGQLVESEPPSSVHFPIFDQVKVPDNITSFKCITPQNVDGSNSKISLIIIHGTWAQPELDTQFARSIEQFAHELAYKKETIVECFWISWSGNNNPKDRILAGNFLASTIGQDYFKNSKIYIVTHSHGGNVALAAMQALEYKKYNQRIEAIIGFGTPALSKKYQSFSLSTVLKRMFHFYSMGDFVQTSGSLYDTNGNLKERKYDQDDIPSSDCMIYNIRTLINNKEPGHTGDAGIKKIAVCLWPLINEIRKKYTIFKVYNLHANFDEESNQLYLAPSKEVDDMNWKVHMLHSLMCETKREDAYEYGLMLKKINPFLKKLTTKKCPLSKEVIEQSCRDPESVKDYYKWYLLRDLTSDVQEEFSRGRRQHDLFYLKYGNKLFERDCLPARTLTSFFRPAIDFLFSTVLTDDHWENQLSYEYNEDGKKYGFPKSISCGLIKKDDKESTVKIVPGCTWRSH